MALEQIHAGIAAAHRALAAAYEELIKHDPGEATTPKPRGRGRPPAGEAPSPAAAPVAATAPVVTPAATPEEDPFAAAAPVVPAATIDEVRKALIDLKNATSQENALAVLKAVGGADNLPSLPVAKYGAVVAAIKKAITPAPTAVEDDPFAVGAPAEPAKPLTVEELKALIVETQKRTSGDTVQKLVMDHGGKKAIPTGGEGPSLPALPPENYAAVAKALKALPSTK